MHTITMHVWNVCVVCAARASNAVAHAHRDNHSNLEKPINHSILRTLAEEEGRKKRKRKKGSLRRGKRMWREEEGVRDTILHTGIHSYTDIHNRVGTESPLYLSLAASLPTIHSLPPILPSCPLNP